VIDPKIKLTVLHDDGGAFTDFSNEAVDYTRDEFDLVLTTDDKLYIGFSKPFNAAYLELNTANTNATTFTAEYNDGTNWVSLATFFDESKGATRSGFFRWDKPTDWAEATVDSKSRFFIRISTSANMLAGTKFQGLNLVFSDDQDLKKLFPEVLSTSVLPSGAPSHILAHLAARDDIIQELRNKGYIINEGTLPGNKKVLTVWDLLDVEEIRRAAAYRALAQVYFEISDNPDDIYWAKYNDYLSKYSRMNLVTKLSVDTDNDGIKDTSEASAESRMVRVSR